MFSLPHPPPAPFDKPRTPQIHKRILEKFLSGSRCITAKAFACLMKWARLQGWRGWMSDLGPGPLKMEDWCGVGGRGARHAEGWRSHPSLVESQTRPTLPPVMSRGPDHGVNYSYRVSWERCSEWRGLLKPHRILQFYQWFFFVFFVVAASIHTTKSNPESCLAV